MVREVSVPSSQRGRKLVLRSLFLKLQMAYRQIQRFGGMDVFVNLTALPNFRLVRHPPEAAAVGPRVTPSSEPPEFCHDDESLAIIRPASSGG
jgi:hypothetical protein